MGVSGALTVLLKWAKRITALGLFTVLCVSFWAILWPQPKTDRIDQADAIICLGGGMSEQGQLYESSRARTETCVHLYEQGIAPYVAFSGGNWHNQGPSSGARMADYAQSLGLPERAVVIEGASLSTLQNAKFTLPLLDHQDHLILVTDAFHLPRSYLSFKWAGAKNLSLVASAPNIEEYDIPISLMILREAMALWFNALRAAIWSFANLFALQNDNWLA